MTRASAKLDAYVYFYVPAREPDEWARTDLWRSASDIPGVHVVEDRRNVLARVFSAATSGQTLLYDPQGKLVFNGGITAFRGHSGDNYGRDAIIALTRGETVPRSTAPVFGCSLLDLNQGGE